jgi:hypothetical protein
MRFFGVANILRSIPTPFPNPGAENYAVQVMTQFPQYDAGGAGRLTKRQMQIFSPNIVVTNEFVAYGYGGIQTGQFAMQPLIIPSG